jgi:hypothetical protein
MERQEQLLSEFQELQCQYKSQPTPENGRKLHQAFLKLQAEETRKQTQNTLAEVLARSALEHREHREHREHEQEQKDLREAILASQSQMPVTGWGGGLNRGKPSKFPAAAASSASRAQEEKELQACMAASLKTLKEDTEARFNKEEQELKAEMLFNGKINAASRAPDAALQNNFDKVGKLVVTGGINSRYDSMQAVVLQYDKDENQFLVQMNPPPPGTDGKLWVDPGQLFEMHGAQEV